jgi:hypothetical protein
LQRIAGILGFSPNRNIPCSLISDGIIMMAIPPGKFIVLKAQFGLAKIETIITG